MLSLLPILSRFVEKAPVPVMARGLIERTVGTEALDAWFEEQHVGWADEGSPSLAEIRE